MSRFTPDSEEHKQTLIERALKLKPKYLPNVVATSKGWSQPRPSGYMELLVSFSGLDALLGEESNIDQDVSAEPIEIQSSDIEEEQKEEPATEVKTKKKGGRPSKKAIEEKAGE